MGGVTSSWLRRLRLPWRRWRVVGQVDAADELPESLAPKDAVLIGTLEQPRWIAFDCPCRDRHRVMLNLDRSRRPTWRLVRADRLTIAPSVDELRQGVRCHYFVKAGRIEWVRSYIDHDKRPSV